MLIITPTGTGVLGWLAALCLGLIALVYLLRYRLHHAQPSANDSRTKLAAANVFSLSGPIHRLALCVALGLAFLTVNWTSFGAAASDDFFVEMAVDDFAEVIPPTTQTPPPPPPLPPPPPKIEPVEEPETEPAPLNDQHIDDRQAVSATPPPKPSKTAPPAPIPPPLPPPPVDNAPVIFAERMPVFGSDCQELSTEAERKSCSDNSLLAFISSQIRYPAMARSNNIEGRVVLSFIVEKDGSLTDIEILRDPGGGLGEESARVIGLIDAKTEGFRPGSQQGQLVRVKYMVPVKFSLDR